MRRRSRPLAALAFVMLAPSCFATGPPISGESQTIGDVTVSFRIDPAVVRVGEGVRFSITLRNNGGRPMELTFPSGKRYDFWVTEDGREIWRWSDGIAFIQVVQTEELPPQTSRSFAETWAPGTRGRFTAHAAIFAEDLDRELDGDLQVR